MIPGDTMTTLVALCVRQGATNVVIAFQCDALYGRAIARPYSEFYAIAAELVSSTAKPCFIMVNINGMASVARSGTCVHITCSIRYDYEHTVKQNRGRVCSMSSSTIC